jgi:hypothetical protein
MIGKNRVGKRKRNAEGEREGEIFYTKLNEQNELNLLLFQ